MEMQEPEKQSQHLSRRLVAAGNIYGFSYVNFTIGGHEVKDYESFNVLKPSALGFEDCIFIPLISIKEAPEKNKWTYLAFNFRPIIEQNSLEFPSFEINDKNPKELKEQIREKCVKNTGIQIKDLEIIEEINEFPAVYTDPACCDKKSKVFTIKISLEEKELSLLKEQKSIEMIEIEGNLLEKLKKIVRERNCILQDKAWYWCMGMTFKNKGGFF